MIKIIIFDLDGVIDNTYELHYQLVNKQITGLTREEHKQLFDGNIHVEREKLKHRDTGFNMEQYFSGSKKDRKIEPEIKKILEILSKKYKIGIISSAKEYGIKEQMEANHMLNIFSFIWGAETDKIKVHKFNKLFQEFDVNHDECLFITDTLGDILEAKKVGIKTIAVEEGYHERERLEKGNPFKIISKLEDLIPTIENIK